MLKTNDDLVKYLIETSLLTSNRLIEAFKKIDRKKFVPSESKDHAYRDSALPIGYGQTISQPYTVAFMLELLEPRTGQKILDIGSGSGWTTALLGQIVGKKGKVIGLELVPELIEYSQNNLLSYNLPQVSINQAKESVIGLPGKKFERILVSAAADDVPQQLFSQLESTSDSEAILVIPVRNSIFKFTKSKSGKVKKEEYPGFAFVPLIE